MYFVRSRLIEILCQVYMRKNTKDGTIDASTPFVAAGALTNAVKTYFGMSTLARTIHCVVCVCVCVWLLLLMM